jgi:hypothetical protein
MMAPQSNARPDRCFLAKIAGAFSDPSKNDVSVCRRIRKTSFFSAWWFSEFVSSSRIPHPEKPKYKKYSIPWKKSQTRVFESEENSNPENDLNLKETNCVAIQEKT